MDRIYANISLVYLKLLELKEQFRLIIEGQVPICCERVSVTWLL